MTTKMGFCRDLLTKFKEAEKHGRAYFVPLEPFSWLAP
jgi:hypothetical protein